MRLKGKTAILTGAGAGIGREIAILFSEEGANVVASDIDEREAKKTVSMIREKKGNAISGKCDVTSETDAKRIVHRCIRSFGRIDILCNNAGVDPYGNVTEATDESWKRCIDINLNSVRLLSKHVIPIMIRQRGGSIINTSSIAALQAISNQAAYCASKGGVVALTQSMAIDYASYNIRVNCLCPGPTGTRMTFESIRRLREGEKYRRALIRSIPMRRFGTPRELAYGALFLASSESSYMTGATLVVDGGLTAYAVPA